MLGHGSRAPSGTNHLHTMTMISNRFRAVAFLLPLAFTACSSDAGRGSGGGGGEGGGEGTVCASSAECGGTDVCVDGACGPRPDGWQLGIGDGTAASVGVTFIYAPDSPRETTDIAFDPSHENRLWVLMREYESSDPCGEQVATPEGCSSLEGSTAIIDNPGTDAASVQVIKDPNAWHFMRRPTGIAFGAGQTFATCGEARTGNFTDNSIDYMGPSLWSSDLAIYGIQPPGLNGSHLDMLHQTPFCMGIAHQNDNVYWVFNGNAGAIDKVDFQGDHGPGQDDHSNGEYFRYVLGQVARVPNVPSHLAFHQPSGKLYIADTGNGRIVRLDTQTGSMGPQITPLYDPIDPAVQMDGAVLEDVVPSGTLQQPSGLTVAGDVLFASDYATNVIYAFDLDGTLLRTLQIELPPGSVTGLTLGPDELLYFTEKPTGTVYRIEPILCRLRDGRHGESRWVARRRRRTRVRLRARRDRHLRAR